MNRKMASDLSVVEVSGGAFELRHSNQPLQTSMGGDNPIRHERREFLNHMKLELLERGALKIVDQKVTEPKAFDSYALFSLQKDWVETGRDNLTTDLLQALIHDPLLERSANPATWELQSCASAVESWLAELGVRLVDLDYVNHDKISDIPEAHWRVNANMGEDDQQAFLDLWRTLQVTYNGFSAEQKSVATYLTNIWNNFVTFAMCLASGSCTPNQFATAIAVYAETTLNGDNDAIEEIYLHANADANRAVRFLELALMTR